MSSKFKEENGKFNFVMLIIGIVLCLCGLLFTALDQYTLKDAIEDRSLHCSDSVCTITSSEVMEIFTPTVWNNALSILGLMAILITMMFVPNIVDKQGMEIVIFVTLAVTIALVFF